MKYKSQDAKSPRENVQKRPVRGQTISDLVLLPVYMGNTKQNEFQEL